MNVYQFSAGQEGRVQSITFINEITVLRNDSKLQ